MIQINSRDLAQLTRSERMSRVIAQFVQMESQAVEQMAARNRRRAVGLARDAEERGTPEAQEFAEPETFVDECDVMEVEAV